MEIVVTGRNVEVPDHFRTLVTDKVSRLERYDHKIIGMQVELFHEPNRRQLKSCQRVEITGRSCGSVARAEATAGDFYAALDLAISKLESRLRRSHDRRRFTARRTRVMAGRAAGPPTDLAALADEVGDGLADAAIPSPRAHDEDLPPEEVYAVDAFLAGGDLPGDPERRPGRVVRRKVHTAKPMTVDEALAHMELVGHDFYLFADVDSGDPSVVYRRRGYDYGVIRLGT